jgi:hypothetical protein
MNPHYSFLEDYPFVENLVGGSEGWISPQQREAAIRDGRYVSATVCATVPGEGFTAIGNTSFIWLASVTDSDVAIRFLFTLAKNRREGRADALLQAVERRFPNRGWSISLVVPEGMGDGFMRKKGFLPHVLRQIEMIRAL